jgi:hypothetical protein
MTKPVADEPRMERMIILAERLIAALEGDIAALKAGTPLQMKTIDPEVQRLSALYAREAQGLDVGAAQGARFELTAKLKATTARFRDVLALHMRMLTRVKNASEGIIRAVAEEVDRKNAHGRPYAPGVASTPRPASAMVYNSVI